MSQSSVAMAQSIVGSSQNRAEHDFYPTPSEATYGLLSVASLPKNLPIWEPCCGDGAISKILCREGYRVISTDLIDYGYGETRNFFSFSRPLAPVIVTNPPFWDKEQGVKAEDFLRHALRLGVDSIYFFCKLTFLEGETRSQLLERSPLRKVWVFRGRVSCRAENGSNGGMIAYAWYWWQKGYQGAGEIGWCDKLSCGEFRQGNLFAPVDEAAAR